jgi:hypothetical protein
MQQRDEAKVNENNCEIVFPPPGYTHEKQHAIPPGLVPMAIIER